MIIKLRSKLSQIFQSKQFWVTILVPNLFFFFLFLIKEEFRQIYTYFAVITCSLFILFISQIILKIQQKFPVKLPNSKPRVEEKDDWKSKIASFCLYLWSKKIVKYLVFMVLLISSIHLHEDIINHHLLTIYFLPLVSLWANNANILLFLTSILTTIFFVFLVIKWQINHILAGFLLFLCFVLNLMMLIVPSDYFRIITKCSDFMIVSQVFRSKNSELYPNPYQLLHTILTHPKTQILIQIN